MSRLRGFAQSNELQILIINIDAFNKKTNNVIHQPQDRLSGRRPIEFIQAVNPIVILDEPTRGIDVAAKAQIHTLIRQMARDGPAVLMISSDLPEVLTLSDRIYVMHEGAVTGELAGADATEEKVMALATQDGSGHSFAVNIR